MQAAWTHTTVLLEEAVDALLGHAPPYGDVQPPMYVDATFGRGGHSRLILSRLSSEARLLAFDKDPDALAEAASIHDARFSIRHDGFAQLQDLPTASVNGILFDLGVSSPQVDNPQRGFSFRSQGPLDMRMDCTRGESVAQWLTHAPQEQIAQVIRDYGEERFASAIARAIVQRRQSHGEFKTTLELSELVAGVVKTREAGQNPATRTFQAFRIFINDELGQLQTALRACLRILRAGGRLVVISFHSLEDRIVKQFISEHSRQVYDRRAPFAAAAPMHLRPIARTRPTPAEVAANARSRSAIMRVAERTDLVWGGA